MNATSEREKNHAAYRKLKTTIAERFPLGCFVAIHGGKIVADAPTFEALTKMLREASVKPREALIVEAGVDYPDKAVIL